MFVSVRMHCRRRVGRKITESWRVLLASLRKKKNGKKKTQQSLEMLLFVENENRSEIYVHGSMLCSKRNFPVCCYIVVHSPQK